MPPDEAPSSAEALREARVRDVMSAPLVTCFPDVPIRDVASLMTGHRIHAVVVLEDPERPLQGDHRWSIISDLDLVAAAPFGDEDVPAGRIAGTPPVVIDADDSLARAALLMAEYAVTHLIVEGPGGEASGIVSALDVAEALCPPAPPPAPREASGPGGSARAEPGDRLVIRGHHLGEPDRDAEILEARGAAGGPPFLVRWEDGGRISLIYPGSDATVQRLGAGGS